jgi:hypothetical protein
MQTTIIAYNAQIFSRLVRVAIESTLDGQAEEDIGDIILGVGEVLGNLIRHDPDGEKIAIINYYGSNRLVIKIRSESHIEHREEILQVLE